MTILYFLILLTVIICIHELGHLVAAKLFGVYCYEYAFGMGPTLFKKKGKETVFSIRAIPIGGFVAMAGEEDGDEAYPDVVVPKGRRITDQKPWKKIVIMLAGVFMNFILAWVLFSGIILNNGVFVQSPKPIIDQVVENTPAQRAGFEAGDRIVKITAEDGTSSKPSNYNDLQMFVSQFPGEELTYTVQRNETTLDLSVTPEWIEEDGVYRIGIVGPTPVLSDVNFLNCWKYGLQEMGMITTMMLGALKQLFFGARFDQLSGPVGIYSATETTVSWGFASYLFLMAELSLNVGIFNLLPLPVLDGGQVVIVLCEGIAGRKLNAKVKMVLMIACWALLLCIMAFATWNDISRLLMK